MHDVGEAPACSKSVVPEDRPRAEVIGFFIFIVLAVTRLLGILLVVEATLRAWYIVNDSGTMFKSKAHKNRKLVGQPEITKLNRDSTVTQP